MARIPVIVSVLREGNSGNLVTEMKNLTQEFDKEQDKQRAIIDGDSSIGCPVIAIVRGVWGDERCYMPLPKESMPLQKEQDLYKNEKENTLQS